MIDAPGLGVGVTEDALDYGGGHLLDQVNGIVHIQLVQDFFQLGVGEGLDEQLLLLGVHLHEDLGGQLLGEEAVDQWEAVLRELGQDGGDVGGLKEEEQVSYFMPSLSYG